MNLSKDKINQVVDKLEDTEWAMTVVNDNHVELCHNGVVKLTIINDDMKLLKLVHATRIARLSGVYYNNHNEYMENWLKEL